MLLRVHARGARSRESAYRSGRASFHRADDQLCDEGAKGWVWQSVSRWATDEKNTAEGRIARVAVIGRICLTLNYGC